METELTDQFHVVKTRNKRTKPQRKADRLVIADMIVRGKSYRQIHDYLKELRDYKISYSQVRYDAGVIQKQWVEEYLTDINEMKAKELARIDVIEQEAWEAWERSKRTIAKTEKEQVENEQIDKSDTMYQKHRKTRAKKTEQERDADKEFMKIIQWCVDKRCEILGINAAKRYDINWRKQAQAAGINPDTVLDGLTTQFVEMAKKGLSDG
jgi:hypothetical protein